MGINFPDLQVLLPRLTEMGRLPSAGQQVDAHQQSLAMAAQAESERRLRRVGRSGDATRGEGIRRESAGRRARSEEPPAGHDKLGRHLDVRG
ncbi:MAG TPA: hypothetical protein VIK93_01985 [Limnochordales bacterium]